MESGSVGFWFLECLWRSKTWKALLFRNVWKRKKKKQPFSVNHFWLFLNIFHFIAYMESSIYDAHKKWPLFKRGHGAFKKCVCSKFQIFIPVRFTCIPTLNLRSLYRRGKWEKRNEMRWNENEMKWETRIHFFCKLNIKGQCFLHANIYNIQWRLKYLQVHEKTFNEK